jgi:hypothetical protein
LVNLTNLRYLEVTFNRIHGSLPDAFKALKVLEYAGFGANLLTGSIPSSWSNLRRLQFAVFANNSGLYGCLPKSWEAQFQTDKFAPRAEVRKFLLMGTNITGFCSA